MKKRKIDVIDIVFFIVFLLLAAVTLIAPQVIK